MKKVIVIGGGPAGLFAAINCAAKDIEVKILEKTDSPGKKLLITGSGQCNLTHSGEMEDFLRHYYEGSKFLKHSLLTFKNTDLMSFFQNHKLALVKTEKGKIFPKSMKASDVLATLIKSCKSKNISFHYSSRVKKISRNKDGFIVETSDNIYESDAVIIATGGKSYPWTGSTGDGYSFASSLGHKIIEAVPALAPLTIKDYPFTDISGVSLENRNISLWRGNKKLAEITGDLLFTHKGISGPAVLHLSRYVKKADTVKINFIDLPDAGQFDKLLAVKLSKNGKQSIKRILEYIELPKSLIERLIVISGIKSDSRGSEIKKEERKKLSKNLTEFSMVVNSSENFKLAMVTRGGVSLKEINPNTLESRLVPGLFFAGEVIDIDGETGGYNLQAAFSTAYVAGNSVRKSANQS